MDEMESAVVSVSARLDQSYAEDWFNVLCEAYDSSGGSWDTVKNTLASRAQEIGSTDVVETFVQYMDNQVSDQLGVLAQLAERRTELPGLYERLVVEERQALAAAQASAAGEAPTAGWSADEAAGWYDHFTRSNDWAGWSGDDQDWDQFKEWYLYYAGQSEVTEYAQMFLDEIESASGGKIAGFAAMGITITPSNAPAQSTPESTPAEWGDRTAEWYDKLTTESGWAGWSGDDQDWDQFKQWFLYYAGQAGATTQATTFITTVENSTDKRAAFVAAGITLPAAQADIVQIQAPAQPDKELEAAAKTEVVPMLEEIIEENPELGQLTDDDIAKVLESITTADIAALSKPK